MKLTKTTKQKSTCSSKNVSDAEDPLMTKLQETMEQFSLNDSFPPKLPAEIWTHILGFVPSIENEVSIRLISHDLNNAWKVALPGELKAKLRAEMQTFITNKAAVLKKTRNLGRFSEAVESAYTKLESLNTDCPSYFVINKVLYALNRSIMRARIEKDKLAQIEKNKLEPSIRKTPGLDCRDCYLSRFPTDLLDDKELAPYWGSVRMLNLSNNQLSRLPEDIGQLSNLRALFISNNRIGHLPKSIAQLVQLEWLCADNNSLTMLPKMSQLVQLKKLHIFNNPLINLPENMAKLANIEWLSLDSFSNDGILPLEFNPLIVTLNDKSPKGTKAKN